MEHPGYKSTYDFLFEDELLFYKMNHQFKVKTT